MLIYQFVPIIIYIYVNYFRSKGSKLYRTIRNSGGFGNWKIVTLEHDDDIEDLEERERYWYYSLKPNLNGVVPSRYDSKRMKTSWVYRKFITIDLDI